MIAGAWICLLAPFAGALGITLAGRRISRRTAGWISTLSTFVAFGGALVAFVGLWAADPSDREQVSTAYTWLAAGDFEVGMEILVDTLAAVMMLVVSGVGGLIVWYSMGYMAGSDEERRYFAYMAIFVFSMLLLVESGNFLLLLAGWGLVGLASYLLIGFDHHRPAAIIAAKKAFVMNAVGDATMALALFLLVSKAGTLDYSPIFEAAEQGALTDTVLMLVALGLLGGAVAKSAQVPIHTWLPDAMEGPTPVSALIHAATMVTAGVYMVARIFGVFSSSEQVMNVIAIV
ncbi:MAG TPA: proton-conducting transporter membrane subunit, partial [Gaiellaceae bacterium]|nr:proton-conducting transporter membrane subunit [Gaiellaceae bacterium]